MRKFNYDPQGDFNVSRAVSDIILVYDADMSRVASFSGDNAEETYGYFIHGVATHGSYEVFNLDTGQFIVGSVGTIVADPAPTMKQFMGSTLTRVQAAD